MPKKRDTSPEAKLQAVITALETSDQMNHPSHHRAIRDLILVGPFLVNETYREAFRTPHPLASLWRAQLVQHLRNLIGHPGHEAWPPLESEGRYRFSAALVDGRVYVTVDTQSIWDLALLHLEFLLHVVGLRNVRVCLAPDCPHLFVKTYRREYCSTRCQQRHNKQQHRNTKRDITARRLQRRRVARGRS